MLPGYWMPTIEWKPRMSANSDPLPDGRFLVIGCGSIGKRHLGNLQQLGVKQLAAFDLRADRRREVEEQFGVPTFADLMSALAAEARVALICTPTHLHLEHALTAARSGCHLFIEKPVADRLDGVDELLELVSQQYLHTLIGCNYRFHPGLQHVKALLEQEAIGHVISARANFGHFLPNWHPWEDYRQGYSASRAMGGGVVLDRIHEFDYLRWLLGEVVETCALTGQLSQLEVDTEDTAEVLLRFVTGAFGSIHLDYVRRTYDCSLELVGERGTIQWCYQDSSVRWYLAGEARWHSLQWSDYAGNQMYIDEMKHFLRVIRGEEKAQLDAAAGTRDLAIALAARQAAEERRAVAV
jgi:predicted dehydrogenase